MSKKIIVGNKAIGKNCPTYIIAEIGINHNGSFELAKQLIEESAAAGADAVKFQSYSPDKYVTAQDKERFERIGKFCCKGATIALAIDLSSSL